MATSPHFCPNCGAALQPGARVCPACGTTLAGRDSSKKWLLIGLLGLTGLICITVLIVAGVGAALAFGLYTRATQTAPTAVVVTEPLAEATLPAATPLPVDTPTPVTALPTPNARYEGLSFQLDTAIGSSINGQTVEAVPPSDDVPPWEVAPQYIQAGINAYPLTGTFHKPQVLVYPVEDYEAMSDEVAHTISELRTLLDEQPTNPDFIPLLPFWNAAQMFRSNVRYLEFQNGRGVRFLTQYGQGVAPIANQAVFYTFQGLTKDGKYYISVILPVNHPELPATTEMTQEEYEQLADNYLEYLNGVVPMLESQPDGSFTPSLDALDALVGSIVVVP